MSNIEHFDFLIVDDEEYICQLLERWLTLEGYTCKTAGGGKKAIDLLKRDTFQAVITDVMMPDVTGIDVLDYVREHLEFTPVIMITGMEDSRFIKRAYGLGVYGYINKPLNHSEMLSNVINALRRRELEIDNKKYSDHLEETIAERTKEIEGALESIADIMKQVVVEENFDVRFENPEIPACYIEMDCHKEDCPCYGKEGVRCWQVAGTYCGGESQGQFVEKYGKCSQCPVFEKATSQYIRGIGEHFNNMMNLLASKHRDLSSSYKELQDAQKELLEKNKTEDQ